MEKHFVVRWCIDEFESNPLEAIRKAILALPHQSNEDTIATVFEVDEIENGKVIKTHTIDVLDEGCDPFNMDDLLNYGKSLYELEDETLKDAEDFSNELFMHLKPKDQDILGD